MRCCKLKWKMRHRLPATRPPVTGNPAVCFLRKVSERSLKLLPDALTCPGRSSSCTPLLSHFLLSFSRIFLPFLPVLPHHPVIMKAGHLVMMCAQPAPSQAMLASAPRGREPSAAEGGSAASRAEGPRRGTHGRLCGQSPRLLGQPERKLGRNRR